MVVADGWLIDPSLDQVSSAEHGVVIPPDIYTMNLGEAAKRFAEGQSWVDAQCLFNGCEFEISYRPLQKIDDSWRSSPAWHDEAVPIIAGEIIAAMGPMT